MANHYEQEGYNFCIMEGIGESYSCDFCGGYGQTPFTVIHRPKCVRHENQALRTQLAAKDTLLREADTLLGQVPHFLDDLDKTLDKAIDSWRNRPEIKALMKEVG